MKQLYVLSGFIVKAKTVDTIYVIAATVNDALAESSSFAQDVTHVDTQPLGKNWN